MPTTPTHNASLTGKIEIPDRTRTDFRLSKESLRLMRAIAQQLGIGRVHVIELAVREMAEKRGVK